MECGALDVCVYIASHMHAELHWQALCLRINEVCLRRMRARHADPVVLFPEAAANRVAAGRDRLSGVAGGLLRLPGENLTFYLIVNLIILNG